MEISTHSRLARRLGSVLEPVVGQVYFSPECHANYVALGFDRSRGDANGVAQPDGPTYFASRGSLLGHLDATGPDTHLSQQGRHAREQIEVATDEQMRPALEALGGDIEELFDLVGPWGEAIRTAKGYPGAGHDLG